MALLASLLEWSAVFFGIVSLLRWWVHRKWGSVDKSNEISISGKTVLVTGANVGIGREAAFEFADRNARVILACRDPKRADDAVKWIRRKTTRGELICMNLDLASLQSVREFCKEFNAKYDKLDILVNNAGVQFTGNQWSETKDGFEIHMGVNHLGHFLLTNLLLKPLKNAAPSRIVTVSSDLHRRGIMDFDDLMFEKKKPYGYFTLYSNSKLANALFNKELGKRLQGTGVNCYALCPGIVDSELHRNQKGALAWILWALSPVLGYILLKSLPEGAATTVYCALSKNLSNQTGDMYQNCGHWDEKTRIPLKDEPMERLWKESARLVSL